MKPTLAILLLALFPACACESPPGGDGDAGPSDGAVTDAGGGLDAGLLDAGTDGGAADAGETGDGGSCEIPCGAVCCEAGQLCQDGACVTPTACADDDTCQDDRYCDLAAGYCVPYGTGPRGDTDPECRNVVVVGVFAPKIQCAWEGPPAGDPWPNHVNVLGTPMVVDFDLDGDRAARHPSVVFVSYDGIDGGAGSCVGDATWRGVIRVIDGATCAQQHNVDAVPVIAASALALGDLDGDGRAEIVAHRVGGGMVAFRFDPAAGAFVTLWETTSTLGAGICQWGGPSIHDLDDDGVPEVIQGASVFAGPTGAVRDDRLGLQYFSPGQIPVVADLDGDGRPELIDGASVHEWDPALGGWVDLPAVLGGLGLVAVADFGTFGADPAADDRSTLDGTPELVIVTTGTVRLVTPEGRTVFGPLALPFFPPSIDAGRGGPPTVGDFDGDGRAEFAVAGKGAYAVFDPDCAGGGGAACPSGRTDGILWAMPTQDFSSSSTGSSVFDFEGDGRAEAVYADECFSRVYDGATGEILHSQYRTSCTWYENPIVADVDGDYNSEIVIPSNASCAIVCPPLDPLFDGLRCQQDDECPGGAPCRREDPADAWGRCRCGADLACGGSGYVCSDPIAGPSPAGRVCRAGHPALPQTGVRIISDALDRWVDSRPIWNQHAYSVTHVYDSGVVRRTRDWVPNWEIAGLNNFRQNVVGDLESDVLPDLTGRGDDRSCLEGVTYPAAQVCNRGTQPVAAGVTAGFYHAGVLACVALTTGVLQPGACEEVSCAWTGAPSDTPEVELEVVVDDARLGQANTECKEGNNRGTFTVAPCTFNPP